MRGKNKAFFYHGGMEKMESKRDKIITNFGLELLSTAPW